MRKWGGREEGGVGGAFDDVVGRVEGEREKIVGGGGGEEMCGEGKEM